jgi:hypothetical protein
MVFHTRYETSGAKNALRQRSAFVELFALLTVFAIVIGYLLAAPNGSKTDTWYKDPHRTQLDQTFEDLAKFGDGWLFDLHSRGVVTATTRETRNTPRPIACPAPVALAEPIQAHGTAQLPRVSGLAAAITLTVCGCGSHEFNAALMTANGFLDSRLPVIPLRGKPASSRSEPRTRKRLRQAEATIDTEVANSLTAKAGARCPGFFIGHCIQDWEEKHSQKKAVGGRRLVALRPYSSASSTTS